MPPTRPLIAYSHLRWDFVYQRPQHVLSRIAASRPVLFVEEPAHADGPPRWEVTVVAPGVRRCVPRLALDGGGFAAGERAGMPRMLRELTRSLGIRRHDAWLYTPMALELALELAPELVVYDCMDELSAFLGAPPELGARERELLARADVVFTGGHSLYRAKRALHHDVHCLPSSVDAEHFRRARGEDLREPADQAQLPHPRLGFFGVLDERLDRDLLAHVADARPAWQLVLVGPIVKIDPASLPRRANLHYLGRREYAQLPAYLAGWDVCLLPFALNESTRYISPTKTLEYMAAERPIVSTPVRDVVDSYAGIVGIGATPAEFVAECERALTAPHDVAAMRRVLRSTSWDATVATMEAALARAANALRVHGGEPVS